MADSPARLEWSRLIFCFTGGVLGPLTSTKTAEPSVGPLALTPLKDLFDLPSQRTTDLKAELIIVGALRGSTLRVFAPLRLNTGSGTEVPESFIAPETPVNLVLNTPWEDATLVVSLTAVWNGKSAGVRSVPGLKLAWPGPPKVVKPPAVPGLSWPLVLMSPPPLKWHDAQAWPPLPSCWSQNRALPRAMAAGLL